MELRHMCTWRIRNLKVNGCMGLEKLHPCCDDAAYTVHMRPCLWGAAP